MRIKKGDNIMMMSGKDRGKTGRVLDIFPSQNRLVIEGLNLIKKHTRARQQGQKGQIISKERAVNVSSAALICKHCNKPTRIGFKISAIGGSASGGEGKTKIRFCKKCKKEIN